ncbi:hypothetical protein NSZ01_23920 [Nocardioides szechwanensis]|uniref:Preprotein translocase subunit SecD n=1 Tax=Nocardioides szechwanensis TaxID=1005944 RepID=A0A1H0EMQ0_9ACTN|nr:hypothetical protein [Nocardioides szechwanensis]GEP34624.1 hypothetical protein NSZ01_23920 [Nocardioides szechwanensis]SDN83631.1 preprotein translocase subunit SecD [Nocardioides szechwanensis]
MTRVRPLLAGVLAVCLGGLAGCGDDEPDRAEAPDVSSSVAPASPVELRVVLATDLEPPPDSQVLQQFDNLDCDAAPAEVAADEPLATCDDAGVKYSLEPARIVGGIESASAGIPEGKEAWVVTLDLDAEATRTFADLTAELAVSRLQVAVVVDGRVVTAPLVQAPIADGRLQIAADLTEESATALADRLAQG